MKAKQVLLFSVMLFCLAGTFRASAATYAVKAHGGGNFTTIQACANSAVAGDTCTVFAGVYPEYVIIRTSGRAWSPVTFQVNPGDSVVVRGFSITGHSYITIGGATTSAGFEITDPTLSSSRPDGVYLQSTTHVTIQHNKIHECGTAQGIRLMYRYPSSYTVIKGNTIAWPAAHPAPPCTWGCGHGAAGILVNGDHTLVDGNDISHVTDFMAAYGSFNVIRNNTFHDVRLADLPSTTDPMHVDGIESYCTTLLSPIIHNLYEGNTETNNLVPNGHAWLLHACNSHGVIIRENAILNLGSDYLYDDMGGFYDVKDYNNTVANFQIAVSSPNHFVATFASKAIRGAMINDIFYNGRQPDGSYWVATDATTLPTFVGSHNLGYSTSCGACTYLAPFLSEAGNIMNKNPLFVSPSSNLRLQASSPARGAGTYLTIVASGDAGWGTSLIVKDAGFFSDGYGIVNADWIRVGSANTVQISSINYATNTITLASGITRSVGTPVYLYKNSSGNVVLFGAAPDLGAYQYGSAPPTGLTAVAH